MDRYNTSVKSWGKFGQVSFLNERDRELNVFFFFCQFFRSVRDSMRLYKFDERSSMMKFSIIQLHLTFFDFLTYKEQMENCIYSHLIYSHRISLFQIRLHFRVIRLMNPLKGLSVITPLVSLFIQQSPPFSLSSSHTLSYTFHANSFTGHHPSSPSI